MSRHNKHKPLIVSPTKKLTTSVAEIQRQEKISDRLPSEDFEQD